MVFPSTLPMFDASLSTPNGPQRALSAASGGQTAKSVVQASCGRALQVRCSWQRGRLMPTVRCVLVVLRSCRTGFKSCAGFRACMHADLPTVLLFPHSKQHTPQTNHHKNTDTFTTAATDQFHLQQPADSKNSEDDAGKAW